MRLDLRSLFSQERILGGAAVLAVTQFGASLVGLVRDNTLARTFPGLDIPDIYISSFRLSDLLFQVFIMSAMGTVLVPMLANFKAHNDKKGMAELLSGTIFVGSLVFGGIALLLFFIFPVIAPLLVQFEGEKLELYILFGRLALLSNFLFVAGNACGQYLITVQRYWIYGITPILYTLGTILGTLYLTPHYGPIGPMLGTIGGAIIYVVLRVAAVYFSKCKLGFHPWHTDIGHMGLLMLPRMFALGALQLQLLLFDSIASGLDTGAITINAYARNFQSVIVGVAGIAIAQSAYSLLSQAAAKKEVKRFNIYLRKGILLLLAVTIPGAIVLVLASPIAARLVHISHVLNAFTICLTFYAISIPFESINHLLLRAFYSIKNTMVPAFFSVLSGIVAVGVAWYYSSDYGVFALAIGFTVGQISQTIGLGFFLPTKVRKL